MRFWSSIIAALLLALPASAFTERYCDLDLGTGNNDGTTEEHAWRTLSAMAAGYIAGDRVNIRGTESLSADVTFATSASTTAPIAFRGYTTTIGDGGKPTINYGGDWTIIISGNGILVEDWSFVDGSGNSTNLVSLTGNGVVLFHCDVSTASTNPATGAVSLDNLSYSSIINCTVDLTACTSASGRAVYVNQGYGVIFGSLLRLSGTSTNGQCVRGLWGGRLGGMFNSICQGVGTSAGEGIELNLSTVGGSILLVGNSFYNFQTAVNIAGSGNTGTRMLLINNAIQTVTNGIDLTDAGPDRNNIWILNNAIAQYTTSDIDANLADTEWGNVDVGAYNIFTNAGSGDFTLNNANPGGGQIREQGMPISLFDIDVPYVQDNWADVGAVQRETEAGLLLLTVP